MTSAVDKIANRRHDLIEAKVVSAFEQVRQPDEDPIRIKGQDLLNPSLIEDIEASVKDEPLVVKISRNLFLDAQFSSNKLQKVNLTGKSYLFSDKRAGIIIA